jgi:hypothetical protein
MASTPHQYHRGRSQRNQRNQQQEGKWVSDPEHRR